MNTTAGAPLSILSGDYPDPSILRVGADYYLTNSSFNYAPGLLIWHSRDLRNWRPLCHALNEYDGDVWAPDLVHYQDRFYIYYKTSGGTHVVTADRIEGPWSRPTDVHVGWIDPGHVVGADGRRFLHLSEGHLVELTEDGLSVLGEPHQVYKGWPIPPDWRVEGECLEGPKLLWKEGWCYLLSAQGGTAGPATSHMVIVARSRSAEGPWKNSPYNPMVHTASREEHWWSRGHGTLIDTPDGDWHIVYHAYEKGFHTLGRQTLCEPVEWTHDGWPRLACREAPVAEAQSPIELSDDFAGPELGWQWRFFGEHRRERYALSDDGVRLNAQATKPGDSAPLCCIPQDHSYLVEVEVELQGPDAEAGIFLFYRPDACTGLALRNDGVYFIGMSGNYRVLALDTARIGLRLVNDRHEVDLSVRVPGGEWRRLGNTLEVSGFHHNVFGGFLSLRVGLFAAGDGSAVFRRFRYLPLDEGVS